MTLRRHGIPWLLANCDRQRRWDKLDIPRVLSSLSAPQRLTMLVRYNVVRAVATNMKLLGVPAVFVLGSCALIRGDIELFPAPDIVPASLLPTETQRAVPHERWIDMLPCPRMRDNLIRHWGEFDEEAYLCDASGENCIEVLAEATGMLVWADPWDVRGWELTEGFVRKWRGLLEGCEEAIEASNRWRALRGEAPLDVEI
jgi:hypothetical protein